MHRPRLHLLLPVVLLLALIPVAPAGAAIVSAKTDLADRGGVFPTTFDLLVRDTAGQGNDLLLAGPGDSTIVRVRDSRATLTAGPGCKAVSAAEVTCTVDRRADRYPELDGDSLDVGFVVEAGDGDDRVALAPGAGGDNELFGGAGDDVLQGGAGADRLTGGAGRDRLLGGPGGDALIGDGPDDAAPGAADTGAAADEIEGGPDGTSGDPDTRRDFALYTGRRQAVHVDLSDPGPDGAAQENDVLTGVENLTGGNGDDTLIGDGGPNVLSGGPGRDVARGGAGDDVVTDAERADLGGGDDRFGAIVPDPGMGLPRLTCGSGRDVVSLVSLVRVRPAHDCEFAQFRDGQQIGFFARRTPVGLSLRVRSVDDGDLAVRVRRAGRLAQVGRARFRGVGPADAPRTRSVVVRLDATGRRLAARGSAFDVAIRLRQYTGLLGRLVVRPT